MKRASIRSLGIGLFLAGAVFQIQHLSISGEIKSSHAINEGAYDKSQAELKIVKQQLAQLQLNLENVKKENSTVVNAKNEEKEDKESPSKKSTSNSILIVQPGMNSREISSELESTGIIQNKQDFEDYLDAQNLTGRIQIGEYELDSSLTMKQIAEKITKK
ncbi:hypothetical protein PB01_11720 [Psychrobacillus glaciei]|uniref:Endolytic transglycosylase MltG n=1 Tax=Psychrobacillus glaciei TaxID=2283160 RepID=A0A5J6SN42_9BACI|nr:endolytic transglycosylase MltG [Psychrobacillus glaciei]QFF99440.1 hypothetical protein PB01_11720 [Psychrobacillus glaciei]